MNVMAELFLDGFLLLKHISLISLLNLIYKWTLNNLWLWRQIVLLNLYRQHFYFKIWVFKIFIQMTGGILDDSLRNFRLIRTFLFIFLSFVHLFSVLFPSILFDYVLGRRVVNIKNLVSSVHGYAFVNCHLN